MNDEYIRIFAIMPSDIYKTKDLTSEEKLIAERITALCKKEGYAWISNKALADMYGIREDTVSKHIKHLIDYGYIKCIYGKNNNGNKKRTIYLSNNIWDNEAIISSLDNQSSIGYSSKYNNKNKYKEKYIDNDMVDGHPRYGKDENGIEYWDGKEIPQEIEPIDDQEFLDEWNEFVDSLDNDEE